MKEIRKSRPRSPGIAVALGALRHIVPVALVLGAPSLARAETGVPYDACSGTYVKVSATVPANTPGLYLGVGAAEPTGLTLRAADGTIIPTSLDPATTGSWRTLSIEAALTEGVTYTLSWEDCAGSGSTTFVAAAAAPLPTSAGTLTIGTFSGPSECDESGTPRGNRTADAELVLDPAVKPFAGLATMDTTVEEESAFNSLISPSGGKYLGAMIYKCPFAPPAFHVTAHVRIPGAKVVDSETVVVTPSCPPAGSISCAGGESDASVDAASDDAASDAGPAAAADKSTGCQIGASHSDGSFWMLAVVGLLLGQRRRALRAISGSGRSGSA
jgi:hypothetical protein